MENKTIQPIKIAKLPPGMQGIAVATPLLDYSLDCALGIMSDRLRADKYALIVGSDAEQNPETLLRCSPDVLVLFRAGARHNQDVPVYENAIRNLIGLSRSTGIPVVYYADELLFMENDNLPVRAAVNSDKVIVSSKYLKTWLYASGFSKPIYILPPCVDVGKIDDIPGEHWAVDKSKLNVVIYSAYGLGTNWIWNTFAYIDTYPDRYRNIQFIIVMREVSKTRAFANRFRNVNKVWFDFLPRDELYKLVRTADVQVDFPVPGDVKGIVPQYEHEWINSKSALKYAVAGACRTPIIVSSTDVYPNIKHGVNGFVANTTEEALMILDILNEDRELLRSVADTARKDVEENWDISVRYPQFKEMVLEPYRPKIINTPKANISDNPKKPKIGWILCGPDDVASARIEGKMLHNWLNQHGVCSEIVSQPDKFTHNVLIHGDISDSTKEFVDDGFDMVIFQKVCLGDALPLAQSLSANGIKTAWFISDLLQVEANSGWQFAKAVDMVITTNSYLAGKMEAVKDKIVIIKDAYESPVDLCKESYKAHNPMRVVWFGNASGYELTSSLREITNILGMELITICSPDVQPTKVWNSNTIFNDILECDIVAITSNLEQEFNKCKDENKLVQSLILGMPVVAPNVPAYEEAYRNGIDGWLMTKSVFDYFRHLMALRDSEELRRELGTKGRMQVKDKYHIDTIGNQLLKEIERCMKI
jgi:hypothetical protein